MKLTLEAINQAIAVLFFVCYAYQFVYIPVALLRRRKRLPAAAPHRFAVLIAARNEETVIGDLLDSLHAQDYDMSLITVFVIADNCTDRTAAIASEKGAVVYTRQNKQAVGKGYALEALLAHIKSDYPDGYDAYLVFDADNLLAPDFLTRMNESFSAGNEIITCYRNSKNYGSNWISAGYALWFLRESRFLNGAREALGSSCAVSGTGFLFSQKILNECGGWPFHLLVEDIEFSIHNILSGHRIAICQDAVIYDEQPTDFAQSCRQRLRWSRGFLQVFGRYGSGLLRGVARGNWSCFDMSMAIMPAIVLTSISLLDSIALAALGILKGTGVLPALHVPHALCHRSHHHHHRMEQDQRFHLPQGTLRLYFPHLHVYLYPGQLCGALCQGGMETHPPHRHRQGTGPRLKLFAAFLLCAAAKMRIIGERRSERED